MIQLRFKDNETEKNTLIKRIIMYILGTYTLAFGIALSITTRLGLSAISTSYYSLSNYFTNFTVGELAYITFGILILMQIIILKKDFKKKNFLQILVAIFFGKMIDLNSYLLKDLNEYPFEVLRYICSILSIIIVATGLYFMLVAKIVPNAPEGFILAIAHKYNYKFSNIKVIYDCCSVTFAILFSVIVIGDFSASGVGIGTILALLVGKIIGKIDKIIGNKVKILIYKNKDEVLL